MFRYSNKIISTNLDGDCSAEEGKNCAPGFPPNVLPDLARLAKAHCGKCDCYRLEPGSVSPVFVNKNLMAPGGRRTSGLIPAGQITRSGPTVYLVHKANVNRVLTCHMITDKMGVGKKP